MWHLKYDTNNISTKKQTADTEDRLVVCQGRGKSGGSLIRRLGLADAN